MSILFLTQLTLSWANLGVAQAAPGGTETIPVVNYAGSGVEEGIRTYLCAPTEPTAATGQTNLLGGGNATNPANGDLYNCINRLYKFAIAIGSSLGIFFIVIAGYIYMSAEGNEESVSKAKNILISTLTALVILFVSYILLKAINPDLIQFKPIQPNSVLLPSVTPTPPTGATPTPLGTAPSVGADVATAAQNLLNLSGSKLNINSSDCQCSGNCPNKTLQDLAAGKQAVKDGPGTICNAGYTSVSSSMLNALIASANANNNFTIQSITGGHHSNPSDPHYKGQAVDITPVPGNNASTQASLVSSLWSNSASLIAVECDITGQPHIYTTLPKDGSNNSYSVCIGKSGYHLHVQW